MKAKVLKSFIWNGEVLPVGAVIDVEDERHLDHFQRNGMVSVKKGKGDQQPTQPAETKPASGPSETA